MVAKMNSKTFRTYSELILLPTFEERFQYLSLSGSIGVATFGFDRYLNQNFYTSRQWRLVRDKVIVRDNACDLAIPGRDIYEGIRIHHLNPITIEDFENGDDSVINPEFLICTSLNTHNAIHFGDRRSLTQLSTERRKGDTKLW